MSRTLLRARGVDVDAAGGVPIVRNLWLDFGLEKVAIVGRNGVGKSTLLEVLSRDRQPVRGRIETLGRVRRVGQEPPTGVEGSRGERRFAAVDAAFAAGPDLLLLDEPSDALDAGARDALLRSIDGWHRGLIVVSHDPELLDRFRQFWVVEEGGCRLFEGEYDALVEHLQAEHRRREEAYVAALGSLEADEERHARISRRRQRKKAVGRVHELDRSQSRLRLNHRRGVAQVSQARVRARQEDRIEARRRWARAAGAAVARQLAVELAVPEPVEGPSIAVRDLSLSIEGWHRIGPVSLDLAGQRLALTGPNGVGKTTLIRTLLGECAPTAGLVRTHAGRVGVIRQGASNWELEESLVEHLWRMGASSDEAAEQVVQHRFPLQLATRPMATLSPGERVRAALIALFSRELSALVLDEPTAGLDPVGRAALTDALRAWCGGLVVASHDPVFLAALDPDVHWQLERVRPGL